MANAAEKEITPADTQALPAEPPRAVQSIPKLSIDGVPLDQIPTPKEEYDPAAHPASPFYSHAVTRTSLEQLRSASTLAVNTYNIDLETGNKRPSCEEQNKYPMKKLSNDDCSVWPQRKTLLLQYKQKKRQRGCYPWNTLSRKQKLIAKILILLFIIAVGVGIGVGVSKAVGGTWYQSSTQQSKVGTQ